MPATRHPCERVTATHDSPLGPILLAASEQGLAGLWFQGQRHWPQDAGSWRAQPAHPLLAQARRQLDDYFAGKRAAFDLPLDLGSGTDFQGRVWQALRAIPAGLTESYAALAARIGAPRAVRAVGAAVGRNPVSIIVPCHRVVGATGALTGYAGGLARKTSLLQLEGAIA
jgi:methylated-DNA-[protein]-cysteine S-methyltransferase